MDLHTGRDLRIDFFRGLALVVIFVDHAPGNLLSRLTPKNFGFSNAADVFVLLAGVSAALAYFPLLSERGYRAVFRRIMRRIVEIYSAHIVVLWISIAVLSTATHALYRVEYMGHEIPAWVYGDLWSAVWGSLALTLQPEYLDILPLYVVFLLSVPLLFLLESFRRKIALLAAIALWVVAEIAPLNLPSSRSPAGWYFDPFSWQLLFSIGLIAGIACLKGVRLPRSPGLIAVAVCYLSFAFAASAPCQFRSTSHLCLLGVPDLNVAHLTPWRIAHILTLAYLVTIVLPANAPWLSGRVAQFVVLLGRNSLPVFLAGVIASLMASMMLTEYGTGWQTQVSINCGGVCVLLLTAAWSDRGKVGLYPNWMRELRVGAIVPIAAKSSKQ